MKKYLLLLIIVITTLLSKAQVTCNAAFTFSVNGLNVTFIPAMVGDSINTMHNWSFGDGTSANGVVAPIHAYPGPGVFTARHIITRIALPNTTVVCRDTAYATITITSVPCNIQANFTSVRDSINLRTYYFANTTVNFLPTDSIRWNFGDGSPFNYTINPVHTYAAAGTYNVCLRVKRNMPAGTSLCVSEICRVVVVDSVPPNTCNLQANFGFQIDPANIRHVYFANQTIGFLPTDSIRWSFGDGSPFSYLVNPDHTYAAAGTYNVCIRVKRNTNAGAPTCIRELCRTVIIDSVPPCNIQANFNQQVSPTNTLSVYFVNQTVNFLPTDSIRWNFGDGSPFSYAVNPNHIYASAGTYNVCIRVKRTMPAGSASCVSEFCKQVVVGTTACNYVVDFSSRIDSLNHRKVFFTNLSPNVPGAVATWTFGDGTSSNSWNAEHTFTTTSNLYNVCLRVRYSNTCIKEKCRVIQLPNPNTICTLIPFPNPTSTLINASVSLTAPMLINVRIFNSSNIVVRNLQQSGVVGINTITLNVASLPVGLYRIVANYGNRECKGTFVKVN